LREIIVGRNDITVPDSGTWTRAAAIAPPESLAMLA
jgi:hypothetical protein